MGTFFYKNKLSIYNFTVFTLSLLKGLCCLWNQTEAKRGSNEIATNIFLYIERMAKEGYERMSFYSDNCGGQNKNRNVFCMYTIAAKKWKVDISHRFFETGQTQNEADSMHARIEIEAARREIFSEEEWKQIIRSAKQEGESYEIFELRNADVLDFSQLVQQQNWKKATGGSNVKWSKVREVTANHQTGLVYVRYDLKIADRLTIDPNSELAVPIADLGSYQVPSAYKKKFPLPLKKARDIRDLCRDMAIPSVYHPFYSDILSVTENEENAQEGEQCGDEDASCSDDDEESSGEEV